MQLCRLIGHAQRFHHFADVAVHKVFDAVQCQPYTVVGNASLGEVVRAYTLATIARAYLTFTRGGIFGVGGGKGNLDLVPAADTDLVFGFVVEEWGMIVGLCCVSVLVLFALYAFRNVRLATSSYYAIAGCAAAGMLIFQAALNIFGSTDLLPLTGVTLPLISNGGSSMMASFGILAFIKASGAGGDSR